MSDWLPGFDDDRHTRYTAKGYCPSVHWSKAYCCYQEGHGGQHMAIRMLENGTFVTGDWWD